MTLAAIDGIEAPRAREVTRGEGAESVRSHYAHSLEHILAELERLDLLVQAQVRRARQRHKADEQFQGLVISEHEVDELLARPAGAPQFASSSSNDWIEVQGALGRLEVQIALHKRGSLSAGSGCVSRKSKLFLGCPLLN